MTLFAFIAVAFAVVAVLLLVWPLLRSGRPGATSMMEANLSVYRDQFSELERDLNSGTLTSDQYGQAHAELERRLLEDVETNVQLPKPGAARAGRWAAVVVGVAVPVCAGLLYLHLGNPQALTAPKHAPIDASSITLQEFKEMTAKLAARMEKNPDDALGWTMLGRAYKALERYPDASRALQRAEQLEPGNPEILVDHAEVLALANGGNLQGEPMRLLDRALKINPNNEKALTLAGTAAFGAKDYAGAIRYWERLAPHLPAQSELARALSSGIAEAKARMAGKAPPVETAQRAAVPAKAVSGVVRVASALAARASPEDNVFIFARAAEGPRMPLAVIRKQVKDLPFNFKLDDSMAMTPGLELSSFPRVIVGARISKSGNATPGSGDLQGVSAPVKPGATGVNVVIDSQVP